MSTLRQFGDGDVAVDVNGSSGLQQFSAQLFTVDVQHDVVLEHAEMDLVPVFVEHLSFSEDQRL